MKLTQVKFRNINSYGNRWQTIDFNPDEPGLYQICGENGTGKSTISQVLKMGLYGKVQGKKTIAKCVNRINKSGEISITFETRLGKIDVQRGFLPNSFKLNVAGIEYKQAGVKNVQEYLEENLRPYLLLNFLLKKKNKKYLRQKKNSIKLSIKFQETNKK